MIRVIVTLAAAAFIWSSPARAVVPSVCEAPLSDLTETVAELKVKAVTFKVLTVEERVIFIAKLRVAYRTKMGREAVYLARVTDVLLAIINGKLFFGLVMDGCLSAPATLDSYLREADAGFIRRS